MPIGRLSIERPGLTNRGKMAAPAGLLDLQYPNTTAVRRRAHFAILRAPTSSHTPRKIVFCGRNGRAIVLESHVWRKFFGNSVGRSECYASLAGPPNVLLRRSSGINLVRFCPIFPEFRLA